MAVEFDDRTKDVRRSARGFGLIELMVVVAIVVVLTMIALPSYRHLIQLNRLTTDTNNMIGALNLARNEAVARGRPVTVCASSDGVACTGTGTDDWSSGWIVFTDYDPPGVLNAGLGDAVLRMFGPVGTRDVLNSGGANVGYVSFGRTGVAKFPNPAALQHRFTILTAPCEADMVRTVDISTLGRSESHPGTCP